MGYGLIAYGRGNCGSAESRFEPRFELSNPEDESTGVSIYRDVVSFTLYCFSSRLDLSNLLVEISEDGEHGTYNSAYEDGAYVSPYDGSSSRVLQVDGQRARVYINKTSAWADEAEVFVRVTGYDGFGNEATKETPVKWD